MANTLRSHGQIGDEPATLVDVAAWTQQAIQAMNGLSLHSDPIATSPRPGGVSLQIPLDGQRPRVTVDDGSVIAAPVVRQGYVLRRKTSERDSLRRRDALLKGKEGSRQRRRWENDRLVGNPHAEPPLSTDWDIRPTHPVHAVPYYLAPLWDARYAQQSAVRKDKAQRKLQEQSRATEAVGRVPKDLKEKLKRSRAAKGLLQDLETEVRNFVSSWKSREQQRKDEGILEPSDSEDDEIVFVGRNGQMHDQQAEDAPERERLVFDSPEDDQSASFGRWLVHSLGQYYGLETWSVSVGNPARREAYVGINEFKLKAGRRKTLYTSLPRPLWAMV